MAEEILRTEKLNVGYGSRVIVENVEMRAEAGRIQTLIGPNGAGKSTILKTLIRQIDPLNGSVYLLGGLSLGGQILLEILSQQGDICRNAFIESAMAVPDRFTNALLGPSLACSYPLIQQKWFAKLQFRQLRMKAELFEEYYRDTCRIEKADLTAILKANTAYQIKETLRNCTANVCIFYGQKETAGIRKSAQIIHEMLPGASLTAFPGWYHGDFSVNHPAEYVQAVRSLSE